MIDQLEANLSKCKAKMSTLKVQINARKFTLEQNTDKGMFAFSAGGKSFFQAKLKENLSTLITASAHFDGYINYALQLHKLENTKILHVWIESSGDVTYYGRIIRYNRKERNFTIFYSIPRLHCRWFWWLSLEVPLAEILEDLQAGVLTILWKWTWLEQ